MTRKQIITSDASDQHASVTPASIQYVRTGARRRTARRAAAVDVGVVAVRPFFAY
ncbi:MAG TPA: hypothetical protein VI318_11640 [Baekduia sp.]